MLAVWRRGPGSPRGPLAQPGVNWLALAVVFWPADGEALGSLVLPAHCFFCPQKRQSCGLHRAHCPQTGNWQCRHTGVLACKSSWKEWQLQSPSHTHLGLSGHNVVQERVSERNVALGVGVLAVVGGEGLGMQVESWEAVLINHSRCCDPSGSRVSVACSPLTSFVGTKTVNGPAPFRVSVSPAFSTAATKEVWPAGFEGG